jgi:hypothetical protein
MFFKKPNHKLITFSNMVGFHNSSIPVPASKNVPEWYKKTPNRVPIEDKLDPSIKKCMPVFDAITAGYILHTPCDLEVIQENGEPVYRPGMRETVQHHPRSQAYLHPKANEHKFPKWINAWSIKTPKGYSTLFVPPLHNPNPWFECFPGLVDTDKYFANVNFPFVLKDPKFEGIIPAGTPMIQIIPFKRDEWQFKVGNDKEIFNALENDRELHIFRYDRYKRLFRTPKLWNKTTQEKKHND